MYENELTHYGIKGMKWGVRKKYKSGDKLDDNPNDSKVTRRVKKDYNSMTDVEFRRKYKTSKDVYRKRVNRYGDPYMNSPLANFGKRQEQKIVDRAIRANKSIDKDIKSFEYHKHGIADKRGKTILSSKDVNDIVRGLNEVKLNNIAKTDMYAAGRQETKRVMSELSKSYIMTYDVTSGKYTLRDKD